jgi:hypothetical protein
MTQDETCFTIIESHLKLKTENLKL